MTLLASVQLEGDERTLAQASVPQGVQAVTNVCYHLSGLYRILAARWLDNLGVLPRARCGARLSPDRRPASPQVLERGTSRSVASRAAAFTMLLTMPAA